MANTNFPFLSIHAKPETQTWGGEGGGGSNWKFYSRMHFGELEPFFHFFIMANANFSFLLTPRKPDIQTLTGLVIGSFVLGCIFREVEPFSTFP